MNQQDRYLDGVLSKYKYINKLDIWHDNCYIKIAPKFG